MPEQAAPPLVDMERVYQIESSLNPRAFNKTSGARGLGQITPIVLEEWNNFHPGLPLTRDDLWNPDLNKQVASWYMLERIPFMLKHYKLPVDPEHMLWAYNAGIGKVKRGIKPRETKDYISKYLKALSQ